MSWQLEIPIIVRSWINDLSDSPTYSDERIQQLILVAGQYVSLEVNLKNTYSINLVDMEITPDPTLLDSKDLDFIGLTALKAACILDHSSLRTKAAMEGIRASLAGASLAVGGALKGYETIIAQGPCALYTKLRMDYEFGGAQAIRAVLSPFVGNNFDPTSLSYPGDFRRDIYS